MTADTPTPQPLCEGCRNFDGGQCPLLRSVLDRQGPEAVVSGCTHHDPVAPESDKDAT